MEKRTNGPRRPAAPAPPCATMVEVRFQFGPFQLDDKLFVLTLAYAGNGVVSGAAA